MTFRHRRWHFILWLAIAPTIAMGLILSVAIRPTARTEPGITGVQMHYRAGSTVVPGDVVQP